MYRRFSSIVVVVLIVNKFRVLPISSLFTMSEQGAALQTYNHELVKCKHSLAMEYQSL